MIDKRIKKGLRGMRDRSGMATVRPESLGRKKMARKGRGVKDGDLFD